MDRREVVERLVDLRREVEAGGEVDLVELDTSFALAMWDVCGALGLTEAERATVLGQSANIRVCDFLDEQVWTTERQVATAA